VDAPTAHENAIVGAEASSARLDFTLDGIALLLQVMLSDVEDVTGCQATERRADIGDPAVDTRGDGEQPAD